MGMNKKDKGISIEMLMEGRRIRAARQARRSVERLTEDLKSLLGEANRLMGIVDGENEADG